MPGDISAKMEDYLETIANLSAGDGVARVRDIAQSMGVTMASVTGALRTLKGRSMINQERYGYVTLTARGRTLAESVIRRHDLLTHFLGDILGVDPKTAEEDACRIEHAVSEETLERIEAMAGFLGESKGVLAAKFARYADGAKASAGKSGRRK